MSKTDLPVGVGGVQPVELDVRPFKEAVADREGKDVPIRGAAAFPVGGRRAHPYQFVVDSPNLPLGPVGLQDLHLRDVRNIPLVVGVDLIDVLLAGAHRNEAVAAEERHRTAPKLLIPHRRVLPEAALPPGVAGVAADPVPGCVRREHREHVPARLRQRIPSADADRADLAARLALKRDGELPRSVARVGGVKAGALPRRAGHVVGRKAELRRAQPLPHPGERVADRDARDHRGGGTPSKSRRPDAPCSHSASAGYFAANASPSSVR